MAEESLLTDDLLRQLMSVGEVDLLVGIPTHNNVETIGHAVEAAEQALQHGFSRERTVIVNVDGGSTDGTTDAVMNVTPQATPGNSKGRGLTSLRTERRIVTRYASAPSPGKAMRILVASAELLRAKACAVISPDTANLNDIWVGKLLDPALRQNFDFVAPLYCRQKFDGLLARNVLYPMSRAIFGRPIRELHASEFGFSGRLASYCASEEAWQEDAIQSAPEMWMALGPPRSDFRYCQSYLGPKTPSTVTSGTDIVTAVRQIVGALFWCMESREDAWIDSNGRDPIPNFGPDHEIASDSPRINRKRIFELFRSGVSDLSPILRTILDPDTEAEIQRIATLDEQNFQFGDVLWARTLCDFAAAYHHTVLNRDHLVQALVPLYRGKIYSYLLQHRDSSSEEIDADTERLCGEFERQKSYLVEKWKARSEVKI